MYTHRDMYVIYIYIYLYNPTEEKVPPSAALGLWLSGTNPESPIRRNQISASLGFERFWDSFEGPFTGIFKGSIRSRGLGV